MPQRILGIDLGSWSVKAVLVESSFRGFNLEAVREVAIASNGETDEGENSHRIRLLDALDALLADGELKADVIVAAVPGEAATTRFIQLPFSDARKVEQTISGELADVLPFDMSDAVFDHELVKKTDDKGSVSLCAAAMKDKVGQRLKLLQESEIEPRFLPVDVLQLYNLYTHFLKEDASKAEAPSTPSTDAATFIAPAPGGPPDARLVVDIGHERTLVCACYGEGVAHTRVIRAGGKEVTEAIAKAYEIAWADAEGGKHEDAFVASSRHPAPSDAAQQMSEVVAGGLLTLVRELRRTIQSIRREKRVRVARIDLMGGGSRIRNLANYMAEQLNVPVAHGVAVEQIVGKEIDGPRRPAYACALAFSLRATGDEPVSRIDMRVDEFHYAGQMQHLRKRAPIMAVAAVLLFGLLVMNTGVRYHVIGTREKALDQQFCKITKKVVGREICEPKLAKSVLSEPASELGAFKLPERSAFRVAADLSHLVPKELDVTLSEMEITPSRVRVAGETTNFDAVDQIVAAYGKDECFTDIKKSKLRKKSDGKGVEFQLSIKLGCS